MSTKGRLIAGILLSALANLGSLRPARGEDWPQFRGSNGSGITSSQLQNFDNLGNIIPALDEVNIRRLEVL